MSNWWWNLVEKADWYGWWPRWFWAKQMKKADQAHGYHFDYDP